MDRGSVNDGEYYSGTVVQQIAAANVSTLALITTSIVLFLTLIVKRIASAKTDEKYPPYIPSTIPFLGHAVSFGKTPVEFLLTAYDRYGPVFSFTMVGKTFTYLVGSDAASLFFNSKNDNLNAEEVYGKLTTPVFGKGVAYDVPNPIFLEQKKMLKTGLNIARFRVHVPMIEEETIAYFKRWGNSGDKGKEIRSILNEKVAQHYWDLDGGFTAMAWLLPHWVPLPSFRRRDDAHIKVKEIFYDVIKKRRQNGIREDDMLQTLIDSTYKDGHSLTDDEIAGMLIGLLLAGQHTSSTTGSWLGFFLAKHPDIQQACFEEQLRIRGKDCSRPLDYDEIKECSLLDRCIKETLRLRPPIVTMMRMCKTPQKILGYTIPPGHQVCVSPTTNHRLPDTWDEPEVFKPDRFLDTKGACNEEKFSYVPFGAGRHRCIGESFAYVQIKAIWSTLLRIFEFELIDDRFPPVSVTTMIQTPENPIIRYRLRQPTAAAGN